MLDQSWRPDWKDETPGTYPDHGDDLEAWAWEFLRRNPEFQADFASWDALPDDDGQGNHSPKFADTIGDWTPMEFCQALPGVPAYHGETAGEYERRVGQWVETIYVAFRKKWNVIPKAPACDCIPVWEVPAPPYGLERVDPLLYAQSTMLRERLIYGAGWGEEDEPFVDPVGFDLRYNIDDQLATIREALLARQRGKPVGLFQDEASIPVLSRKSVGQRGKYETRLRYLDAVAAGASDTQIINKLCPSASYRDDGNDESGRFNNAASGWLSSTKKATDSLMTSKYREMLIFAQVAKAKR